MLFPSIFSLSAMLSILTKTKQFFDIYFVDCKCFQLSLVQILSFVNPFPNKPWFLLVCSTSLLKTLREKEKLLKRAIFPFPTVFSTRLDNFMPFSSNFKLSSANSFSLEVSKICRLEKG